MIFCRKLERQDQDRASVPLGPSQPRQRGPVFLPPRTPSKLARELIESTRLDGNAVTAYDEIWFAGRPIE